MSKNKKSSEIVKEENVIQAVLIADNFNENFEPLSNELPVVRRLKNRFLNKM